jgi:hypothetical protein
MTERAELTPPAPPPLAAVIRGEVLTALGRPPGMFRVAVFPLWQNHYRVNVLTGADALSVRIRHSYFVTANDEGDIRSSDPVITRQYGYLNVVPDTKREEQQ